MSKVFYKYQSEFQAAKTLQLMTCKVFTTVQGAKTHVSICALTNR